MADVVFSKVEGLRELGEAMRDLAEEVNLRISRKATNAAAQGVKKIAIQKIISSPSVETGSLRDAVIVKRLPKGQSSLTSEHIVTVRQRKVKRDGKSKTQSAPHAHFVEFGTINMPAEPFLRPAFDQSKRVAVEVMKDVLDEGIMRATRKAIRNA